MGNAFGGKTQRKGGGGEITDTDRAILDLKVRGAAPPRNRARPHSRALSRCARVSHFRTLAIA